MPVPAGYSSNAEPLGAFGVVLRDTAVGATWTEVDLRSTDFLGRADVEAQLDARGITSAEALAGAVLREVAVQCTNADTGVDLSVNAPAGSADPPTPADALQLAMANGGVVGRQFETRQEITVFQYRSADGGDPTDANITVRFDVPK
ncbi:MAG: hypothetical protein GY871_04415 [Actinomycetales bacterium]|nr:hypothetical protein [Actinomycetales bacterium]